MINVIDWNRYKSPHFSRRHLTIDSILLHHTAGIFPGCAHWFTMAESKVSAHLIITRAGEVFGLVDFKKKAWHAGRGAFDLNLDGTVSPAERMWNDRSIGIELESYEAVKFKYTKKQLITLDGIIIFLINAYEIPADHILGHKEIAPNRKVDPLNFFMNSYRHKMRRAA